MTAKQNLSSFKNLSRIGILNGGGDCPGLNTVIDTLVCCLSEKYQVLGFYNSFEGLLAKDFELLKPEKTWPFRFTGGTILNSMNKGIFNSKLGPNKSRELPTELKKQTWQSYQDLGLQALICLGGDGTMTIAKQLSDYGMNIIGIPKSIDNDLAETEFTFGFWTAVETIAESLDKLRTTVASHKQIMVVETMGRYTGWLALYGGLAGGAEVILLPEIEVNYQKLLDFLHKRKQLDNFKNGLLIVISEGLDKQKLANFILKKAKTNLLNLEELKTNFQENQEEYQFISKELNFLLSEKKLGNILAKQLTELLRLENFEARSLVLGHLQRGGYPLAFDRILSRQLGAYACELLEQKKFNSLVIYKQNSLSYTSLDKGVDTLKSVAIDSHILSLAKKQGVYFGD